LTSEIETVCGKRKLPERSTDLKSVGLLSPPVLQHKRLPNFQPNDVTFYYARFWISENFTSRKIAQNPRYSML